MSKAKRILICPLDWGLGHATRCIPIIRMLLEQNAEVIIAADKGPLALLKNEFPQLTFVTLKGYGISYSKLLPMTLSMLLSIPKILSGIKHEHEELKKIVDQYAIDIVISDNRYGCWNNKTKNIFITHQLMIKTPFGEKALHTIVAKYLKQYDECWVPDLEGENNLSGDLSHKYPVLENAYFIGALSRFSKKETTAFAYDIMAVLSGPEPQRSIFEKMVVEQLSKTNLKALVVCGLPSYTFSEKTVGEIKIVPHLDSKKMQEAVISSAVILSRSGYSSVMDLAILNKKVIFVPTPGQTEQEYLAKELKRKNIAFYQKQSRFDLKTALKENENYSGFKDKTYSDAMLLKRIQSFFTGNQIG
jgi:uncharacterized protein (TIGR00661 family)